MVRHKAFRHSIWPGTASGGGRNGNREDHRRSAENVVFEFNPGINGDIVLNLYPVSDDDAGRDYDILAKIAVPPDSGFRHYVGEVPDLCAGANFTVGIDHGCGMSEILRRFYLQIHADSLRSQRSLAAV